LLTGKLVILVVISAVRLLYKHEHPPHRIFLQLVFEWSSRVRFADEPDTAYAISQLVAHFPLPNENYHGLISRRRERAAES
jgi:hypothetical protein